jgi:hypothetical protein
MCRLVAWKAALTFAQGKALEIPTVTEVKGDDGPVPVRPAANDAYKVSTGVMNMVRSDNL